MKQIIYCFSRFGKTYTNLRFTCLVDALNCAVSDIELNNALPNYISVDGVKCFDREAIKACKDKTIDIWEKFSNK